MTVSQAVLFNCIIFSPSIPFADLINESFVLGTVPKKLGKACEVLIF